MAIKTKTIWLHRAEGEIGPDSTATVATWAEAESVLRGWSHTAPEDGSYHKCDFKITYEDGQVYDGRYDLTQPRDVTLEEHVRHFVEVGSGYRRPAKWDEKTHQMILNRNPELTKSLGIFREKYAIGDAA